MKLIYRILVSAGCCFFTAKGYAQEVAILPYKVIANKMIVEVRLNGKLVPMLFDTGGKNAITTALKNELGTAVISSREIMDGNSNKKAVDIVKLNQVETPDAKAIFKDVPFVVFDNEYLFPCLEIKGLIGSDLWQNSTIEINDQTKEIRITKGGMEALKADPKVVPFADRISGDPIFFAKIGKHDEERMLFDSGAECFLSIRAKSYPKLEGQGALYRIRQGVGGGSVGALGRGGTGTRILLEIPEFILGGTSFTKFRSSVGNSPETLLGYQVLQYGKVTIDYVNKLFRFEPFSPENIELKKELKENWSLEPIQEGNQLIIGTVWEQMEGEAEVGDVITHIDGKEVKPISYCEYMVTGIPAFEEKKQVVLTLTTKQGTKNITINKN